MHSQKHGADAVKLLKDEIVTIQILRLQGETNQAIAQRLGISEGSVRYHLKRQAQKAIDGRAKQSLVEQLQLIEVVDHWWKDQLESLPKDRWTIKQLAPFRTLCLRHHH